MHFLQKFLLIASAGLVSLSSAHAAYQTYTDAAAFSAAVKDAVTDHFSNDAYLTNAQAKAASVANIGYVSTGFSNHNIVSGGFLCWGCNGSGYMDLSDTTIGTASGVYGFMTGLASNININAYVSFANGTTADFVLGDKRLFAITSSDLISKVEFSTARDQAAYQVVAFDYVTVANASAKAVPEPASITLLGLGLAGIASLGRRKKV